MKIFAFRELQRGGTLSPTSGCDEQMKVHQLIGRGVMLQGTMSKTKTANRENSHRCVGLFLQRLRGTNDMHCLTRRHLDMVLVRGPSFHLRRTWILCWTLYLLHSDVPGGSGEQLLSAEPPGSLAPGWQDSYHLQKVKGHLENRRTHTFD